MRTAHGGQLAILVGSPVMFVALTATADKAISKKAETGRIVLVLCDCGQCKERHFIRGCCYARTSTRTAWMRIALPFTCFRKYLYILISCSSRIIDSMTFPISQFQFVSMYPAVDLYSYICLLPTRFKRLCGVVRSP